MRWDFRSDTNPLSYYPVMSNFEVNSVKTEVSISLHFYGEKYMFLTLTYKTSDEVKSSL